MNISKQCLMLILTTFIFLNISLSGGDMELYKQDEDVFNFNLSSPEEFLEFLKKDISRFPENFFFPYTIKEQPSDNWIKPEHIPGLINLINSQEPCSPVMSIFSSTIPTKLSTIGDEAMFMIEGFRAKRYPPRPNSRTYTSKEKEAILQWWRDWSKQNNIQK